MLKWASAIKCYFITRLKLNFVSDWCVTVNTGSVVFESTLLDFSASGRTLALDESEMFNMYFKDELSATVIVN